MSSKLIFRFRHAGAVEPSHSDIIRRFGLKPGELDEEFGVQRADEKQALYVVRIDERARTRIEECLKRESYDPDAGVYSNPLIENFGQPE